MLFRSVESKDNVPSSDGGFYPGDEYIVSKNAYEVSWVLHKLQDIYNNNDFYDLDIKYELFGTFASHYKKYQTKYNKGILADKMILLNVIREMIYSDHPFLPLDDEQINEFKGYKLDTNIGAES